VSRTHASITSRGETCGANNSAATAWDTTQRAASSRCSARGTFTPCAARLTSSSSRMNRTGTCSSRRPPPRKRNHGTRPSRWPSSGSLTRSCSGTRARGASGAATASSTRLCRRSSASTSTAASSASTPCPRRWRRGVASAGSRRSPSLSSASSGTCLTQALICFPPHFPLPLTLPSWMSPLYVICSRRLTPRTQNY